jgi:hypothetical protein
MTDVVETQPADATLDMVQAFARVATCVSVVDAEALLREIEHTDAIMPILDPTAYMKIGANIPGHRRLVRAFLAFRRELREITGQ